jgi:hypothetical protein
VSNGDSDLEGTEFTVELVGIELTPEQGDDIHSEIVRVIVQHIPDLSDNPPGTREDYRRHRGHYRRHRPPIQH